MMQSLLQAWINLNYQVFQVHSYITGSHFGDRITNIAKMGGGSRSLPNQKWSKSKKWGADKSHSGYTQTQRVSTPPPPPTLGLLALGSPLHLWDHRGESPHCPSYQTTSVNHGMNYYNIKSSVFVIKSIWLYVHERFLKRFSIEQTIGNINMRAGFGRFSCSVSFLLPPIHDACTKG